MAGLLLPLAAVGAIAATWYQLPGVVIAWLVVLVTAWTEPPVELTGKKDAYGYPTPANPEQEAKLASLRAWKAMRWRLLAPGAHWLPGWPVLASWLAALVGALLVLAVPVTLPAFAVELLPAPGPGGVVVAPDGSVSIAGSTDYAALVSAFGPAANALATFVLLTAAGATRRDRLGHGCPGVRVNSLPAAIRANPLTAGLSTLGALVGAGALVYALTTFVPSARVQATTVPTWCWAVAAAALVLAAQWPAWSHAALDRWREVVGARRTWAERWPSVKMADPAADLVDRITAGGVVVDVFDAPASIGASGYLGLAPRLAPVVGSGHDVVVLGHPQMGEKGPIPGSTDPRRFRVVDIEGDARPDLGDPALDDDVMELMVEVGMAQAADALGWARPALAAVSPVHDPGSAGAVYKVEWVGLSWPTLRAQVGSLPGFFGCEVLVDHHGQGMYLGVLTVVAEPPLDAELAAKFVQLARQDKWNAVWGTASLERHKTSQPVVYHPKYATAELPGGAVLERVVLTTRQGIPPEDYFGTEKKLAATLNGAPFVAVTGFPGASGRPGDRHPQAICVYSCAQPVPATLNALAPVEGAAVAQVDPDPEQPGSRGRGARPPRPRPERPAPTADLATTWVIAGALNRAFEQIKLPRPEVVSAHALTRGRARAVHLWKVEVRLHGDTSLSDVRSRAEKLRQALGVPWLRVAEAGDGVTLYAGAEPGRVSLVNPVTDGATLVSLDWEQAFNDSGLLGSGGRLPQLAKVGALEHNAEVAVLDFALPSGLDVNMVRAAIRRLKSSTGNDFIELRASPLGPSHARLLVCGVNPLPERAAFDFEAAACSEELLFATGIEGQPVGFDPTSSPHLLVAGVTGGGKSVTAQNILWGAAVKGYTVVVIDPMKQAADFQFLAEHAAGFAVDLFEAAALLKAVYAQVRQRMTLNAVHKVGNYRELPEDVRPEPLLVFIDEFTSLMGKDAPPAASEDPEVQDEIAAVKAANDARATIGTLVGKMAREARSAGVHLVLGTQKLKQDVLDKVPSASELKTNLARSLMGNATRGDRTSALRNGDDAPELGESTPPGRGLFEPLTTPVALAIQCWFAPQGTGASGAGPGTLAFELSARVPALDPSRRLDFSQFLSGHPGDDGHVYGPPPGFGTGEPDAGPGPSGSEELGPTVLDLGEIDLDLDLDEAAFTDADEFEMAPATTPNTTSETDQDEQNDRAQHSDQDQPTGEAAAGPGSATQVGAHGATSAHRATSGPGLVVAPQEPTAGLPDRGGTDAAVGGDADRGDLDHDGADGGTGRGGVPGVGQRGLLGPDDPDESDVHRVAGPGTPLPVVAPDRGGLSAEDLFG